MTYWLSPRNKLQVGYRLQTVSPAFVEGGRLADYSARSEFMVGHNISVAGFFQYEQWMFPALDSTRQSDVTATLQITYFPNWGIRK